LRNRFELSTLLRPQNGLQAFLDGYRLAGDPVQQIFGLQQQPQVGADVRDGFQTFAAGAKFFQQRLVFPLQFHTTNGTLDQLAKALVQSRLTWARTHGDPARQTPLKMHIDHGTLLLWQGVMSLTGGGAGEMRCA
jgi:hypothetical protein